MPNTKTSFQMKSSSVAWRWLLAAPLLAVFLAQPVSAQKPPGLSMGEISLLPAYCIDTMGMRPGAPSRTHGSNAAYWFKQFGETFRAMHHYCWALVGMRRANGAGTTSQRREAMLLQATGDLSYVINHSEPNFPLLAEVLVTLGDVQTRRKKYDQAVLAYYTARQKRPEYARTYANWANLLANLGDRKGALTLLEEGMNAAPGDMALHGLYKQLGGDPRKFVPKVSVNSPPAASAAAVAPVLAPPPEASAPEPGG